MQICSGDDAAFVFFRGAILNKRVDWNCKEPRPETERGEQRCRPPQSHVHEAERDARGGHANGTKRNEAVFDLVSADQPCYHAPDSDAYGERDIEVGSSGLANMKNVRSIDHDRRKKQRTEKPEVGVAKNGEEQRPVAAHEAD